MNLTKLMRIRFKNSRNLIINNNRIKEELLIYRSSYKKQLNRRIPLYDTSRKGEFDFVLVSLILNAFSRSFGMMLIGMSLCTGSIFSKFKEKSFYRKMLLWGFGIGLPLSMMGLALSYLFG